SGHGRSWGCGFPWVPPVIVLTCVSISHPIREGTPGSISESELAGACADQGAVRVVVDHLARRGIELHGRIVRVHPGPQPLHDIENRERRDGLPREGTEGPRQGPHARGVAPVGGV